MLNAIYFQIENLSKNEDPETRVVLEKMQNLQEKVKNYLFSGS